MMADGNPGTEVADMIDALEAKHEQRHSQLRRDTHILLSGVSVAIGAALVAIASITPTISLVAVLLGVIAVGYSVGHTVVRRLITD